MKLNVSQLIPGYTLTEDVVGKTKHPIIKKNTVLTKEHILILKKFLIKNVNVSTYPTINKDLNQTHIPQAALKQQQNLVDDPFIKKYESAVLNYKEHFIKWKSNLPVNMPEVRKIILPLLEYIDELGIRVYQLYNYLDPKDYIYHHDISVAILSAYIAKKLGYKKGEQIQIGLAGFLSNCGKSKLTTNVFMTDKSLTHAERKEIERHPIYSFKMLESISLISESVKMAVLQHHERLDGSGYPLGAIRKKIHPYAQIIAVCDMYFAKTSERLYRKKQSPFKVVETLRDLQHVKFDEKVVQVLINDFLHLSIGKKVILSNFEIGTITSIDDKKQQSPLILLDDSRSIISAGDKQDLFIRDFIFNG